MTFSLTILGTGSAVPTPQRHNSAHLLNVNERIFLIDSAEGVQIQLKRYGIKFQRINHIFISHLHADHYLGIFGLLSTFNLLGRKKELIIYSHPDLEAKIKAVFDKEVFAFNIIFRELNFKEPEIILDYKNITVTSFPLKHRIKVCGFLFREKPNNFRIKKSTIEKYKPSVLQILEIKKGNDLTLGSGKVIPNSKIALPPEKSKSYAYCSDTEYYEKIIPIIKDVDLLYHEATFEEQHRHLIKKTGHSTAADAALIAKKANAEKLVIGHFSMRYKSPSTLVNQAKEIFENTFSANDGDRYFV